MPLSHELPLPCSSFAAARVPTDDSRFCQDFATYKNQGRAGYCFKQFDKKHIEFLYLVPPALAPQVSVCFLLMFLLVRLALVFACRFSFGS